jgi:hypothetical protein
MTPFARLFVFACVAAIPAFAQDDVTVLTGTNTLQASEKTPTGPYQSFASKITLASTTISTAVDSAVSNGTDTSTKTSSETVTRLTGSVRTTPTGNSSATASSTSSSAEPTNTTPCNNYPEFCSRKYSNITMVSCHNSPFVRPGSAASNQQLDVVAQLNDGVRFLQAQIQWPSNGTVPHFCHGSCDVLDAGPITDWLGKVKTWVAAHPYDVVTVLLGNGNYSSPDLYVPFIEETGILQYIYTPPVQPMNLEDWPTLSKMILSGKRVVMFLDYDANQTAYPWLLDQFSQMWETPFDPTDKSFPCTVQRPPDLAPDAARDRLYLMNHNFNVEVSLLGASMLVPDVSSLNQTNNVSGPGSLGLAANNCRSDWGRAPNFLNVDYYNYGGFPGSVFEVAAKMNNVTYDRPCCGVNSNGAVGLQYPGTLLFTGSGWLLVWLLI